MCDQARDALLAHPLYVAVNGAIRVASGVLSEHRVEQLVSRKQYAGPTSQRNKDCKFAVCQAKSGVANLHRLAAKIERQSLEFPKLMLVLHVTP